MGQKLTVIVPIYNGEEYLIQCIDSIINQTYKNLEIILVDNKSTDSTGAICDTFAKKDSRIKVIHREVHGWISDGRNDGLKNATGDWITFVDADDWLELDFYQEMFNRFPQDSEKADIVFSGGNYRDLNNKKYIISKYLNLPFDYNTRSDIVGIIDKLLNVITSRQQGMYAAVWDKFYRTDFLKCNNLKFATDVLVHDDLYFNLITLEKAKRIVGVDVIGYHYRYNPKSVTNIYKPEVDVKLEHDLKKIKQYIQNVDIYNYLEPSFNNRVIGGAFHICKTKYFNPNNNAPYRTRKNEFKNWMNKDIFRSAIYGKKNMMRISCKIRILFIKLHLYFPFEYYYRIRKR